MIEVKDFNAYRDGFRRCMQCFDVSSREQHITELKIGHRTSGMQIYLCDECLKSLHNKISGQINKTEKDKKGVDVFSEGAK